MAEKQTIGWIGLGKMGQPMAKNLIKAGYQVTGYAYKPAARQAVIQAGGQAEETISALVQKVDVVISMIPDDAILNSVSTEVFSAAKPDTVYIDMSTVSPMASEKVAMAAADKNIAYLRAPVSGSTALAETAGLTILASGPENTVKACKSIFDTMGQKCFYVGNGEQARFLKIVLNIMVGLSSGIVGEALAFGEKGGLDWEQMIDIVNNSVVASPLVSYKAQMLKDRNFAPAFSADQMAKDFDIALATARNTQVPIPMTSLMRQLFASMNAMGSGEQDFFAYVTLLEKMAAIQH